MFRPAKHAPMRVLLVLLLCGALQQLSTAGWIRGKALLAQALIADAWQQSLSQGGAVKRPWPWADTWPVARLRAPTAEQDLYVLAGARGNALAFGPGMNMGAGRPGGLGTVLLGGHRDTPCAFLSDVQAGDPLQLQATDGRWHHYRIVAARVVDSRAAPLLLDPRAPGLLLVTCYPFDALASGGPLRFLVLAEPVVQSLTPASTLHTSHHRPTEYWL